jgi:hypothetical protein
MPDGDAIGSQRAAQAQAPPNFLQRHRVVAAAVGLAVLASQVLVVDLLWRLAFDSSYLELYLTWGASLALVYAVAANAWREIDRDVSFIAAHPFEFVGSNLQLFGLAGISMSHVVKPSSRPGGAIGADSFLTAIFGVAFILATYAWLFVSLPVHYVASLVIGAPARLSARTPTATVARLEPGTHQLQHDAAAIPLSETRQRQGWWEANLFARPVSYVASLQALVLLTLNLLAR